MEKSQLRKIYLEKRKQLSLLETQKLSLQITQNFQHNFALEKVNNIHIFLPIQKLKEVDTWHLIRYFWNNGKNVFVPKIHNDIMQSHLLTPRTELQKNHWDIDEPNNHHTENQHFDLIITPLLYCDPKGNRIGYGKGFYDKFFQNINTNAIKIGVNYFTPQERISDILPTDIPLDYLITPTEMLSFGD